MVTVLKDRETQNEINELEYKIKKLKGKDTEETRIYTMNELGEIKATLKLMLGAITGCDSSFIQYSIKDVDDLVYTLEMLYRKIGELDEFVDLNFRGE